MGKKKKNEDLSDLATVSQAEIQFGPKINQLSEAQEKTN